MEIPTKPELINKSQIYKGKCMKIRVDRIENNQAVLIFQNQQLIVPLKFLPNQIKEGDFLKADFSINKKETDKSKNKISKLLDEVFDDNKK